MAESGAELEVLGELVRSLHVDLTADPAAGCARIANHERPGVGVHPVLERRQPERVVIDQPPPLLRWPPLDARHQVVYVPPGNTVGDSVLLMVGGEQLVERAAPPV